MASILSNDDAEALLLDIRTSRTVADQRVDQVDGAFMVFPTSVVVAHPAGGQMVFPLKTDIEPGTLVRTDGGADVAATVEGVSVSGRFTWTLARDEPSAAVAPAVYRFQRRGRDVAPPAWAGCLPASRCLLAEPAPALGRQRRRLLRQGRAAEYWLLRLTERIVRQSCRGPMRRAINHRPHVDVDDVVQRGMQVACRLLAVYASPQRPPCSWLGMLRLDGQRDMHREISKLDWLPPDVSAVVALAEVADLAPGFDPSATLAALTAAAERVGRRFPAVGPGQIRAALSAPSLTALESLPPAQVDATIAQAEPGIDAVDEAWGWAASAIARLVTDDPRVIALAGQGDANALSQVGAKVIDVLAAGRESAGATRRRCWAEFQRSGQLLDTDAFRQRVGSTAIGLNLAAIDESLRHAAGTGGHAPGAW